MRSFPLRQHLARLPGFEVVCVAAAIAGIYGIALTTILGWLAFVGVSALVGRAVLRHTRPMQEAPGLVSVARRGLRAAHRPGAARRAD